MAVVAMYADGFPNKYQKDRSAKCPRRKTGGCDEAEVGAFQWSPSTIDFKAAAKGVKHAVAVIGVKSGPQMCAAAKRYRNITRLVLFAHGSSTSVNFGAGRYLDQQSLGSLIDLSPHFSKTGTIDLLSCGTGVGGELVQKLANTFRVTVRATTRVVKYHRDWNGESPHRYIDKRWHEPVGCDVAKKPAK